MEHSPGFLAIVQDAKARVHEIDIKAYKSMLAVADEHVLIDVREDHEFSTAHVHGAVHLSKGLIERDIEKLFPDKNAKLVLYCGGGFRSALAADNIQKIGYSNVLSLDGGWHALEVSGLRLERESH